MHTCKQSANAAVRGVSVPHGHGHWHGHAQEHLHNPSVRALSVNGNAANFSGRSPIFSGKVPIFSGNFAGRVGAAHVRTSGGATSRPVSARSYMGGGTRSSGPVVGGFMPIRQEEKQ
jgi:hypothetical protein